MVDGKHRKNQTRGHLLLNAVVIILSFLYFSCQSQPIPEYPNITVPMGSIDGLPVGISFFGSAWSEPVLIEIAYAYETATNHRFVPTFKTAP